MSGPPVLAHRTHGERGPPIVVLHGLFGSGRNWAGIAKRLARSYTVHTLDLPDHGASPWSDGPLTYPAMADAVAATMDRLGLPTATLLGHSMGGKTAMTLALDRGERVDALIVVDIAPVAYRGGDHLEIIRAMQAVDLSAVRRRSEVEHALADGVAEPDVRRFLVQNLDTGHGGPEAGGARWRLNLDNLAASMDHLLDFPIPEAMEPFGGPTLVLAGGASDYVTAAREAAVHRLFPDATVHRLDGLGHWPHARDPALFTEHVLDFLAHAG